MEKQVRMYALVEEFLCSGEPVTTYCRLNDLQPSMFYYWRKKYASEHFEGSFIELREQETETVENPGIEIVYRSGTRLRLSHYNLHQIKELLNLERCFV